jgi:hypothetical protein
MVRNEGSKALQQAAFSPGALFAASRVYGQNL